MEVDCRTGPTWCPQGRNDLIWRLTSRYASVADVRVHVQLGVRSSLGYGVTGSPPYFGYGWSRFESWWPSTVEHRVENPKPFGARASERGTVCRRGPQGPLAEFESWWPSNAPVAEWQTRQHEVLVSSGVPVQVRLGVLALHNAA